MARRGGGDTVTVVYPQGCREINDELGNDELIRRLKSLAHTFQGLGQVRVPQIQGFLAVNDKSNLNHCSAII